MQAVVRKRLSGSVFIALDSCSPSLCLTRTYPPLPSSASTCCCCLWDCSCRRFMSCLLSSRHSTTNRSPNIFLSSTKSNLLPSPFSFFFFFRGLKIEGSSVRPGNVIEKKDRIYEVLKVEHSHEGRGKATIKLELRDVDSGNKVTQRLGTDESVERVYVETKTYIYMCTDRDGKVLLMDPDTLDQLEVNEEFFGKNAKYLKDEMKIKVQLYNGVPLSASIPKHVTCIVREAQPPMKGIAATPKDKIAVLENGLTVKVPPHIIVGEAVIVDTEDDSYVRRVKV